MLLQDILEKIASLDSHMSEVTNRSKKTKFGSCLCGILVWIAAGLYLIILSVFFVHVSIHGEFPMWFILQFKIFSLLAGPKWEMAIFSKVLSPAEW